MLGQLNLIMRGEREQFWQWDTGREMEVIGAEGCTEVHFAWPGCNDSLTLQIREVDGIRVVSVPDVILQRSGQFVAYLYAYDDTGAETRYAKRFYVKPRPKPADYVYTPEETQSWKRLSDRIDELEESGIETIALETMIALKVAPVLLDGDGAVLVDGDGAILLNM